MRIWTEFFSALSGKNITFCLFFMLLSEKSLIVLLFLDFIDHRVVQPIFRFENAKMLIEEFFAKIWNGNYSGPNLDRWHKRLRS